jgi:hypothetical protein
VSADRRQ